MEENNGLSWGAGELKKKKETYPAGKGKKKKINNDTYLGAGKGGVKKRGQKVKIKTGLYLGLGGMGK
jgi:hypothetical protein